MIELYNNFITTEESDEFIRYYNANTYSEFYNDNDVYRFKGVHVKNYEDFDISKKLDLSNVDGNKRTIQLVDSSMNTSESFHVHSISWSYIIFLNDDFIGGDLLIENFRIKPRKNQLIIFPGNLPHRVENVTKGKRYTLVSFIDKKIKPKNNLI